ncbi:MAG TPA: L,D-transpeptidase family protein [Pseudolabrys sp.]|nr:L,D-transpeptidase family protein [Pseudolabrys sp.]
MRKAAIVVFAALAGAPLPALAQMAQSEPANAGTGLLAPGALTTELPNGFQQNSSSKLQALISGDLSKFVDRKPEQVAAEAFYQARNYQPIWTGSPEALKRAEGAIAFLRNLKSEGLEPRDYPTPDLSGNLSEEQAAKAELQLTGSILRYARHASSGRVSYTRVSASILYPDHAADPAEVLDKVASAQDMNAVLQSFEPQQPGFVALKAALAKELAAPEQDPSLQDREASYKKNRGKDANERSRKNAADTIIANMERWRWLPRDLGEAHVVVNVPDFTLGVYKDGARLWHTKIVAGKPGTLATPLLSETMKYLTINPTWNVPPSIIRNEYLPALERDPDALERIGLRVSNNPDGSLRVYQPPGERNALGRIRFNFPNQFLVYQHDTPDKKLFARDSRAFSHGCMRVQDPEKYAEVLLSLSQPEENFTIARIRSLYGGQERTINLKQPIPVHVTYQTAFVDEQGQLNFRHDIYGLDAATLKLMRGDERMIADTPVARPRNASSKPVMARAPAREDREWQGQYENREQGQYRSGGWFGFGAAEQSYASSPYRSRALFRGLNRADGLW